MWDMETRTRYLFSEDGVNCSIVKREQMYHILSKRKGVMTVDRRALSLFAIMLAEDIGSNISEDDGKRWQTPAEFCEAHVALLDLSYEDAMRLSYDEEPDPEPEPELDVFNSEEFFKQNNSR